MSSLLIKNKYKIVIHYIVDEIEGNRYVRIIDDKNIKYLTDENKNKVETLNTSWRDLYYKDHIAANTYSEKVISSKDGGVATMRDPEKYNFWLLSNCMVSWNLKDEDGNPVAIGENILIYLPVIILNSLVEKYKEYIAPNDDFLKN